ncbi:MAG: hypothetical protein QOD41_2692 [Cryptosporangiaceae bacterium]|nr:hypothetical protein [Cryptosporangiaceae bacterium]
MWRRTRFRALEQLSSNSHQRYRDKSPQAEHCPPQAETRRGTPTEPGGRTPAVPPPYPRRSAVTPAGPDRHQLTHIAKGVARGMGTGPAGTLSAATPGKRSRSPQTWLQVPDQPGRPKPRRAGTAADPAVPATGYPRADRTWAPDPRFPTSIRSARTGTRCPESPRSGHHLSPSRPLVVLSRRVHPEVRRARRDRFNGEKKFLRIREGAEPRPAPQGPHPAETRFRGAGRRVRAR